MHHEARLRRVKYRAWHRGFREADLILGPFAEAHAAAMDAEELDAFEALMEADDHALYDWILERVPAPPEQDGPVLARLRAFRYERRPVPV